MGEKRCASDAAAVSARSGGNLDVAVDFRAGDARLLVCTSACSLCSLFDSLKEAPTTTRFSLSDHHNVVACKTEMRNAFLSFGARAGKNGNLGHWSRAGEGWKKKGALLESHFRDWSSAATRTADWRTCPPQL